MLMMNELNHMFLYSANKKVYVPIDETDRRKGSAILFLTPDMKTTMHLTMLPYLFNPRLYQSYYIDRNISAFISKKPVETLDEKDAAAVSEAMVHQSNGTKFRMDKVSTMDEKYIRDVYNKDTVKYFARELGLTNVPDKLNVVVHPSVSDLRKNPAKYIKQNCDDDYFSYTDLEKGTIHILTRMVYDPFSMRGNYEHYLLSELLYALIMSFNNDLPFVTTMGIAYAFSGIHDYMDKEKNCSIDGGKAMQFSETVAKIVSKNQTQVIRNYIKTGNMNLFAKFAMRNVLRTVSKAIFESSLSYMERQRLLPSDFGLPNTREYPIHDEDHIRAAVRMFNHCDPSHEKELAENIIKKMKRYGITDIKVSASNRFKKYYKNPKVLKESADISLEDSRKYPSEVMKHDIVYHLPDMDIELHDGEYGEIIYDENHNIIAYYLVIVFERFGPCYINKLYTDPKYKDAKGYLIGRAFDRQDSEFALVDKDSEDYELFTREGFKPFDVHHDGRIKMTVKDVMAESDCNWSQVQSVCDHLAPHELSRITFTDKYENSKFVIKRYIGRVGTEIDGKPTMVPAGFLDVYQFPSNPEIAQITLAVDSRYRGLGVAKSMVNALDLDKRGLSDRFGFKMLYWTAHPDNEESIFLATRIGRFDDTGIIDKYGRKVFIKEIYSDLAFRDRIMTVDPGDENIAMTENAIVTSDSAFIFEADSPNHSSRLRQYLYAERIRNDKEVLQLYKEAKSYNPNIIKTYLKLEMYKNLNLFVDLSYYHALFLKNNILQKDNAIRLYFQFLNMLMDSNEIHKVYKNTTVFIPIDAHVWNIIPGSDLTDYKKNLNPISIIFRLIRTDPEALRSKWGNKHIVFVGDRGYFTVDFNRFEVKDLARFKKNIERINGTGPVIDEEETDDGSGTTMIDNIDDKYAPKTISSKKAITAGLVDRIEFGSGIKIDDISTTDTSDAKEGKHLSMITGPINIPAENKANSVVVISIDPEGDKGFDKLSNTVLSTLNNKISSYCQPK